MLSPKSPLSISPAWYSTASANMDLMSPSKDVSNAHIPYVYLVAISFLLLRGTLDDSAETGEVSWSATSGWVAAIFLVHINQLVRRVHPKQAHPCTPPPPPPTTLSHQISVDVSEMRWLKAQLAELPKCAGGALLCSPSRFLLRREAGGGWRRSDHLGERGPERLLGLRWEDNSSQLRGGRVFDSG